MGKLIKEKELLFDEFKIDIYLRGMKEENIEFFFIVNLENQNELIYYGNSILDYIYSYFTKNLSNKITKSNTYIIILVNNKVNEKRILEKELDVFLLKKYIIDNYREESKEKCLEQVLESYIPCLIPLENFYIENKEDKVELNKVINEYLMETKILKNVIKGDIFSLKEKPIKNLMDGE